MKGVTCFTKYQKLFIILALLFVPCFFLLKNTNSVSAVNVSTSSFDLYYRSDSTGNYDWKRNILYGSQNGTIINAGGGVREYQWYSTNLTAGGNYAMLHFETNIVSTWYFDYYFNPWVNLYEQNIINCAAGTGISVTSKNLSYSTTLWGNRQANTLTYYGSVTMSGFTIGQQYSFICQVGSVGYSFIDTSDPQVLSANVWFEQNPAYIEWTNNQTDSILNIQVQQNETIINQNEQIIEQNQQDRDDLQNQVGDTSDDASSAASQINTGITPITTLIGNYINIILHPPSEQGCSINMGTLFNAYKAGSYANADLCSLDPPRSFAFP